MNWEEYGRKRETLIEIIREIDLQVNVDKCAWRG
jgi:hypothetical protein